MEGIDTQLITIPIFTVSKVLLVAFIGGFMGGKFAYPQFSTKGISTMTVKIFLPAMLCSRMASDMNMDLLRGGYGWAMLLCLIPLGLGFLMAGLLKFLIKDKDFHGLFLLASTFQNAVSFGLGVTQSIAGPLWIDAAAYSEFATVVFLWNLPHSLAIWSGGTWIVRNAKEDEIRTTYANDLVKYESEKARREEEKQSKAAALALCGGGGSAAETPTSNLISIGCTPPAPRAESPRSKNVLSDNDDDEEEMLSPENGVTVTDAKPIADVTTAGMADVSSPTVNAGSGSALLSSSSPRKKKLKKSASTNNNALVSGSNKKNMAVAVVEEAELKPPVKPSLPPKKEGMEAVKEFLIETFTNITILASLVGMLIGLTPPLRYLVTDTPIGPIFIGGMSVIGTATVPLTLLQLGTNLTSSQKAPKKRMIKETQMVRDEATGQMVERIVEVEAPPRGWIGEYIDNLEAPFIMILLVSFIRLVFIPAVFLVIFLVIRSAGDIPIMGPLPTSKAFQLTILLESCAPTAINSNILCTMFQYKTAAYSQALLGIYVISIATTAIWLSFYLWLLG